MPELVVGREPVLNCDRYILLRESGAPQASYQRLKDPQPSHQRLGRGERRSGAFAITFLTSIEGITDPSRHDGEASRGRPTGPRQFRCTENAERRPTHPPGVPRFVGAAP